MLSKWQAWFKDELDDEEDRAVAFERAREVIAVAEMPYFRRLMEWLEDEANSPVTVSVDHMAMITSATRANTMKEVRKHLLKDIEKAKHTVVSLEESHV